MKRILSLCVLAACAEHAPLGPTSGGSNLGANPLPSSPAPDGLATFRSIYEHILSKRCALPTCHGGSFEPDLGTAAGAYDGLVNAPAFARPHVLRVRAGDPQKSFLLERLTAQAPLPRMPFNLPPLAPEEIARIRDWIAAGALFDEGGPAPVLPNFLPEPPEALVYRGEERIDSPPPAVVHVGETVSFWTTPDDFESAESCSLPHDGNLCVPWAAFGLFDAQFRGLCVESPFEAGVMTPYQIALYDPAGYATGSGSRQSGWHADIAFPAQAFFAPLAADSSCDMSRAEMVPLAGLTLNLAPIFPEDASAMPRYAYQVQTGHVRVVAP
jgi:hypothetical protein